MVRKTTILVVEDDDWMAEQYLRLFTLHEYTVHHASHALAAMDMLDSVSPDVILLDLFLTGPNAFTLLHEMRSHADLAAIPVILCTTSARDIAPEDVAAYGVVRILDKTTMQPGDIVAAVRKALL
jgi:CheY-like chemotaxis protein